MGSLGMCGPKGYGVLAVLTKDRVQIVATLVSNRVCRFFHSFLEFGMFWFFFLQEATPSSLSIRPSTKGLRNAFNIGLN